ncbi:TPA: hypothetical protein ACX6RO_003429 [Photobacterium damselae]
MMAFNIALVFIFFPFIGFFEGVDSQPLFIIYSIVLFLLFFHQLKYLKSNLIICFIFSSLLLLSFIIKSSYIDFKFVATYISVVITFFLISVFIINGYFEINRGFILKIAIVYILVGTVQLFIPDFMAFLVSRSVEDVLTFSDSGRGVRSLAAEPAGLGRIFLILNVLYLFCIHTNKKDKIIDSKNYFFTCLIFLYGTIVLSRSAYAIMLHILILYLYLLFVNKKLFFIFTLVGFVFFISIKVISGVYPDIRALSMFNDLINQPSILLGQGAMRRVLNIPITINNLSFYGIWGASNNPNMYWDTIVTPIGELKYLVHNRNMGGFIEFFLKFGVISIPFYCCYFFAIFKILIAKGVEYNGNKYLGCFFCISVFIITIQDTSPVLPLTWFVFIYIYYYSNTCFK